ncbi:acetylxylan esterase [Microbacterium sp. zg-Y818]|uniref:alpha/beta hydrolase n=2 Tax=Microbacterium TaxID=33882 RepID=UPI00214C52AC|nr:MULTISPECIES: acetylxylan esterase [unclassified Microbacterium]MCR2800981.1 acetylxylan esterase [Microbacterium sp. zg.Y818]WIM23687.1 acetylxylan esterase [Microbacterium sp. zg-Y818]
MRGLGWFVAAAAMAGGVAAALFLPVRFPRPGGELRIGTTTRQWVDRSRPEIFSHDDDEARELSVQIWYPTGQTGGARSRYLPDAHVVFASLLDALREVTSGRTSLPSFLFRKLAVSRTHAFVDVPPLPGTTFPVIVSLSGFGGFRRANTILIEELVSRGYIVVAMDQPYVSARTQRADGRVVKMKRRGRLYDDHPRSRILAHLAADVSFVLDTLKSDPDLGQRVDASRAGVMGVSLGGTVAAVAASADERIAACLMMDAAMPDDVATRGLPCHALWLTRPAEDMRRERRHAGGWPDPVIAETIGSMTATLEHQRAGTGQLVSIPGMYHIDFTDAPHWFPWARWVGLSGRIGAGRAQSIVAQHADSFFDSALRARNASAL